MTATAPTPLILQTDRMYLRELSPEMYGYLFSHITDDEISTYFGFKTEKELEAEKEKFQKGYATYFFSFKIFHLLDKQDNRMLGMCGFHTWVPKHRRAEVGYNLLNDADKGKGLMKEALGAVLAYGFEHMNLYRVEALLAEYNVPSLKLLKYYGFKKEGTVRGHYIVDEVNEDSALYSILLPEFEQLKEQETAETL
ncbi:GNAT family N-acetyltransferase [Pontibacter locisalis]|uniref:GNAT family N-acetyltransferase n=1 Tax=Pontibacter locisalis TaxID=1719035 RepID=A0ABW5IMM3_9BACT